MKNVCIITLILFFVSCGKMPMNGDLDGRWQLMVIDCHEEDVRTAPEYTYYDVSLRLMELKRKGNKDDLGLFGLRARFEQTDDSLHIRMIRCKASQMPPYGMNDTIQRFAIEKLDSKKMILNSDYARLTFRKF